jgi:hypothetical protein
MHEVSSKPQREPVWLELSHVLPTVERYEAGHSLVSKPSRDLRQLGALADTCRAAEEDCRTSS